MCVSSATTIVRCALRDSSAHSAVSPNTTADTSEALAELSVSGPFYSVSPYDGFCFTSATLLRENAKPRTNVGHESPSEEGTAAERRMSAPRTGRGYVFRWRVL